MLIPKKSSNRQHSNPKFYLQNTLTPKSQHCCHQQRIHDELQTNTIRRAKFKRGKTIFHSSFVWWLAAADFLFLRFPRRDLSGTFHFRNHPLFLRTEGIGRCQRRRLVWFFSWKSFFLFCTECSVLLYTYRIVCFISCICFLWLWVPRWFSCFDAFPDDGMRMSVGQKTVFLGKIDHFFILNGLKISLI